MGLLNLLKHDAKKQTVLATGYVVAESNRCVQCGICTYNCPVGINVRLHVWQKKTVKHSRCLTCGECVARCPRGALHFEEIDIFVKRDA
jgi:ferredoxin